MEHLGQTKTFITPSGYEFTIREQHGGDDDVLTSVSDARTLKNLSKFLAGLIIDTDMTDNRSITFEQVHKMPALDKYAILLQSRIHSMGNIVNFTHDWGSDLGEIEYEQDIEEYLLDYAQFPPTEEILNEKPDAIPYYPLRKESTNIMVTLSTGKEITFDLMNAEGEAFIINLPLDRQSKNKELEARNLKLKVDGRFERVTKWSFFTMKEMMEIRKQVAAIDPTFKGNLTIHHPGYPDLTAVLNIVGIPSFFYPGEN